MHLIIVKDSKMVSSDSAPVNHLVVDSVAFFKRAPLLSMGKSLYTIASLIEEIRDKPTREYVTNLPFELIMREPTTESLKKVTEISKKTGDYPTLSATDLKVLALSHDLHVQYCGSDGINYDVQRVTIKETAEREKSPELERRIGFMAGEENGAPQKLNSKSQTSKFHRQNARQSDNHNCYRDDEDDESNEFDSDDATEDGAWISSANFDDALLKFNAGAVRPNADDAAANAAGKIEVACLSGDFAIQNVLMHMRLNVLSVDGLLIKQLKSYILRCRSCFHLTSEMGREFCPRCGNKSLHRAEVVVEPDGSMRVHVDHRRLNVKRGLKHSVAQIRGGKHDQHERLFEGQRLPQNRPAKMKNKATDVSPFVLHDVFSRAAHLGIRAERDGGRANRRAGRRNPNESAGGRRKK